MENQKLKELAAKAIADFDITKYFRAGEFGAREWHAALGLRRTLLDEEDAEFMEIEDDTMLSSIIEWLGEEPLAFMENPHSISRESPTVTDLTIMGAWCLHDYIENHPVEADGCRMYMRRMEAFCKRNLELLKLSSRELVDEVQNAVKESRESFPVTAGEDAARGSYDDMMSIGRDDIIRQAHVTVDLSAPDALLLEHFKLWLTEKRARPGVGSISKRDISESDFRRWGQTRVLPYLDLMIFSKYASVNLPKHRIGAMIFGDQDDIDLGEKVRKVVAPLAERLISKDWLRALYRTANAERIREAEEKH